MGLLDIWCVKSLVAVFLVCLPMIGLGQEGELRGIIKEASSEEPMIGVHIRNITAGTFTISAANGTFKIPVSKGDTLLLTHIGYMDANHFIDDTATSGTLEFHLQRGSTELPEVTVTVFPEYWRFKQMVLETEPVDSVITFDLPVVNYYQPPTIQEKMDPALRPNIGIPFSMDGLTKKGKERKKLQKLLERKTIVDKANLKFNREWVASATKLSGDRLTDFIAFCKFTPEYIAETPLFAIHEKMMALLEDFTKDYPDEKQNRFSPGA